VKLADIDPRPVPTAGKRVGISTTSPGPACARTYSNSGSSAVFVAYPTRAAITHTPAAAIAASAAAATPAGRYADARAARASVATGTSSADTRHGNSSISDGFGNTVTTSDSTTPPAAPTVSGTNTRVPRSAHSPSTTHASCSAATASNQRETTAWCGMRTSARMRCASAKPSGSVGANVTPA
jgi:hypothetical protein